MTHLWAWSLQVDPYFGAVTLYWACNISKGFCSPEFSSYQSVAVELTVDFLYSDAWCSFSVCFGSHEWSFYFRRNRLNRSTSAIHFAIHGCRRLYAATPRWQFEQPATSFPGWSTEAFGCVWSAWIVHPVLPPTRLPVKFHLPLMLRATSRCRSLASPFPLFPAAIVI